jgi:hypothetical protein
MNLEAYGELSTFIGFSLSYWEFDTYLDLEAYWGLSAFLGLDSYQELSTYLDLEPYRELSKN